MSRFVPRSLRARLLLIVLLASVPLVVITVGVQVRQRRAEDARQRETSTRAVHAIVAAQQRTFTQAQRLLVSLSRLPQISEHRPTCPSILSELRTANPFLSNIAVADPSGALVCSALSVTTPVTTADEVWFERAVRERTFNVGGAQVGHLTHQYVFILAQPIVEGDRVTSVLFAGFDLTWFDRLMDESDLPAGAVMTILDHDGTVAWRSEDIDRWLGRPFLIGPVLDAVRQGRGAAETRGPDGIRRFYVFGSWGGAGPDQKYVLVGFLEPSFLAAYSALAWNIGAFAGVVALIALGTHRTAEALVLRPVRRLLDMTDRVTDGDLNAHVEPTGADEMVALSHSFNGMTKALEERGRDRDGAESALAEAQSRLVQILQTIPIGVVVVDPSGAPYLVNRAARTICGTTALNVRSARQLCERLGLRDARTGAPFADARCPLERALAGELVHVTAVEIMSDGRVVPLEVWAAPIFEASGGVTNAIMVLHDLTEQQELEHQYRQAQKMEAVGRLAGGVAHDFNNLLTVILGYADMLLDDEGPAHAVRPEIQAIREAGDRARSLTQQLLAFSRKQVLQPQIVDLNEQVKTLARMLHRLLGEDVELALALSSEPVVVSVDPGQFGQIAMNLAVNARDAMPEGGTLAIETALVAVTDGLTLTPELGPGDYVMVTFRDTGVGMDEATRARVFEPFFTTKERGKGTGLGMAMVYGIVSQSGGTITVQSRPGTGTTFRLYFPAARKAVVAASASALSAGDGGSETLLVVEDHEEVRRFAVRVLEARGYGVISVDTPEAALQALADPSLTVDLLLTDVVLKGINGRRLAALVEEARPGIGVLYMSGYTENVLRSDDPSIAFLQKPFTPTQVAAAVRRVLDVRRAS